MSNFLVIMTTAPKLSFKVDRTRHRGNQEEISRSIINGIMTKLNDLSIEISNIYNPSYNRIKVLFPNETQVNKTLNKYTELKNVGYEPRIPIPLKAARTVYCYGFDPTLLVTNPLPQT